MPIPVFVPEFLLMSHVQSVGRHLNTQKALIFRLSRLDQVTKQNAAKFADLEKAIHQSIDQDIDYFQLSSRDIVIMGLQEFPTSLSEIISKVLLIFGGDSFIATINRGNYDNLCLAMDMRKNIGSFLSFIKTQYENARNRTDDPIDESPIDLSSQYSDGDQHSISLKTLSAFEQPLASNDLSSVTRRQDICLIGEDMRMKIVMSEVFVSIVELTDGILPKGSLVNNLWLFTHLTTLLDKRVLTYLKSHDDARYRSGISINLNVSSFFSSAFRNFDHALDPRNRETIMFELQLIDIIANLEKFYIARDALQARGYRLCIDSVPYTHIAFIDDNLFGLDMIKINASGKFRSLDRETLVNTVRRIEELGSDKFILCRCDDKETVEFGQEMNIKLYQGYYVDRYRRALLEKSLISKKKKFARKSPSAHPRAIRPT